MGIWRRKPRPPSPETHAARQRLDHAQRQLAAAKADDESVDQVARDLVELGRRNHFGPMITQALRGSR